MDIPTKLSAKVIEKTVTEVAKEQQQLTTRLPGEESPFQQMLTSMSDGEGFAANLGMNNAEIGLPSSEINTISAGGIPFDEAQYKVGLGQPDGMQKVVDLLSEVNNGHMQMENLVNQIVFSARRFSNQELLAIQAHVFHFAQVTELVVKAADQGVSSLKTVLNTNIQ